MKNEEKHFKKVVKGSEDLGLCLFGLSSALLSILAYWAFILDLFLLKLIILFFAGLSAFIWFIGVLANLEDRKVYWVEIKKERSK